MKYLLSVLPLLVSTCVARATNLASNSSFAADCSAIAQQLDVANATVYFSEVVTAGTTLSLPDQNATCAGPPVQVLSDVCRVVLYVATSDRSGISMETWLPSNWTGRYLTVGNGGLNGCVGYADLAYGTSLGFAVSGGNNGHNGTSGGAFYNNPDVVADFAWRSVHTSTVVGKQITQTFYEKDYTKAYYLGCSTGGRQGWKSAQDFPDDYDGIVAGAPAIAFENLTAFSGHFYLLTGPPTAPTFLTRAEWTTVHEDILAQCDSLDGATDNIIEDPLYCNYDPSSLACNSTTNPNTTTACLSPAQISTVRSVFSPLYGTNNALVYPRMQPGSELNLAIDLLYTGAPFPYTTDWVRYAVYNDPTWDPTTMNTTDYDNFVTIDPGNIQTFSGDLSAFRSTGGKILHWHGQADGLISSEISPRYYQNVLDTMAETPASLDEFYRFFRISGTGHCSGGDGASRIGQGTSGFTTAEPERNVLMAMVKWVEEGVAPETVEGTSEDDEIVRRHCKWPLTNKFVGVVGEEGDPDAWECVARVGSIELI